eukprot:NODE_382_length_2135_cov_14.927133_g306_i0.p1 GENE.NODE_382_length_2135_cov_14.927133_g306_i0~~NODE_382_length_2135_cov_14.927133_g306_i0.p1  ORF type:complete len:657 (+),score=112.30 NODE_382_length_2135_cov_14.927133_g306_i0:120-2090(+)
MTQVTQLHLPDSNQSLPAETPARYRLASCCEQVLDILFDDQAEIILGRAQGCTLRFSDPKISARHCKLYSWSDQVLCEDTSTNGTFINGKKIGKGCRQVVKHGDEIALVQASTVPGAPPASTPRYIFREERPPACRTEQVGVRQHYELGDSLGAGSYAVVRRAIHRRTGEEFAVKVIAKKRLELSGNLDLSTLFREVHLMEKLDHPNVVRVIESFDTTDEFCMVLEMVSGGDFFEHIMKYKALSESVAKGICYQLASALSYLHAQNICHRDLKPENILVQIMDVTEKKSEDERPSELPPFVKITDFGLAKFYGCGSAMLTFCGTPMYLAPEVTSVDLREHGSRGGYNNAVDVWSLGCVLYITVTGKAPPRLQEETPFLQFINSNEAYQRLWAPKSGELKDLLAQMLAWKPQDRISAAGILKHPWLTGYSCPALNIPYPDKRSLPLAGEVVAAPVNEESISDPPETRTNDLQDRNPTKVAPETPDKSGTPCARGPKPDAATSDAPETEGSGAPQPPPSKRVRVADGSASPAEPDEVHTPSEEVNASASRSVPVGSKRKLSTNPEVSGLDQPALRPPTPSLQETGPSSPSSPVKESRSISTAPEKPVCTPPPAGSAPPGTGITGPLKTLGLSSPAENEEGAAAPSDSADPASPVVPEL